MAKRTVTPNPFRFLPAGGRLSQIAERAASHMLGVSTLAALYEQSRLATDDSFEARALSTLGIRVAVEGHELPVTGPLIIAANHPRGISDGLVLCEAVRSVRPDVKLVVNHLLARVPELADRCFFVDPFGGPEAAARSRAGLRAAHLWLRQGGAIVIFPSGAVAPEPGGEASCQDAPWHATVGRLAIATGATVVPAYIAGRNSDLFYRLGRVHPLLRTVMLGRELLKQRGTTVDVAFGGAITPELRTAADAAQLTASVRSAVEGLQSRPGDVSRGIPVIPAVDRDALADDVAHLHPLVSSGDMDVFCSEASSIPSVLREIGRLRELAFREVGEGTLREIDLDGFDQAYLHLFVWNRKTREVVGAYRVGRTDTILATRGPAGLYTSTLFRYDERLMARLSPALELGRSFVRREYQRNPSALLLLWKGIGQLVARSPQYRTLFGPVSISSRYRDSSQQMLIEFLEQNHRDAELAELVEALNPPSLPPLPGRATGNVGELDALISASEPDGKGIPVLLRQYLRLHARVIGFNVDPTFGDALDALVTVDLTEVDTAILNRYLGKQGAAAFLAYHQRRAA